MQQALDAVSLQLLRRIPIRLRLGLAFFALSVLPLTVGGWLSYVESSQAIQNRAQTFFVEIAKQVAQNVHLEMRQLEAASENFLLSRRVQSDLAGYYGHDAAEQVRARADLTRILLETYGSFDYVNQKYLLDNAYRMIDTQVFSQLRDGAARLAAAAPADGRPAWSTYQSSPNQKSMVMLRRLQVTGDNQMAGTLFVGFKPSRFTEIFDTVRLGSDASIFILDLDGGKVLLQGARNTEAIGRAMSGPGLTDALMAARRAGQESDFIGFNDGGGLPYRAAYARIGKTSLYVVNAVSLQNLMAEPRMIRTRLIWIGLACAGVALLFSRMISRSISLPLGGLVASMNQAGAGDYRTRLAPQGQDEISNLAARFNDMTSRVQEQNDRLEERVVERTRDLAMATRSLEILSATDGLTGIPNRRSFDDVLAREMQRAIRARQPLSLLILDVDLFKNYNDFYGHQAGDDCLRRVATFLHSRLRRASDLVARYGGEEFGFIGIDTDAACALALAESICKDVEALGLAHVRSPFGCITVSIGVASVVPVQGMAPEALIRLADAAMYRAKNSGRNRVCADQPIRLV